MLSVTIIDHKLLDSIPSGSGIVVRNDSAYIIGDDATGIYQLDLKSYQHKKIAITGLDFHKYREPKDVKHDFEAGTFADWKGEEYLLAFGSGSSKSRDSILMVKTASPSDIHIFSLQKFYENLRHSTQSKSTDWNIEGATVAGDFLILLNRGNNLMIKVRMNDFMLYLSDEHASLPAIEYHRVKLPVIEKHEARLSGVCTLDNDHLIFSASVEDTPDWMKDGPVLGSFIGIYSLRDSAVVASCLLEKESGSPLREKIESLDFLRRDPNHNIILIAIGDNDDGTSNLFWLKLETIFTK